MLWTKIKRVSKSGFVSFWRNGSVSLAAVLIMTVTLLVIGSLLLLSALLTSTLTSIKDKVDINVYFVQNANESDILDLQKTLQHLPEVATVSYVTRDQALQDFRARHQNDQLTLQALDELSDNPLGAIVNIKAKDPSQYEGITQFLQSKAVNPTDGSSIIDKINYAQNKNAIDAISRIIKSAEKLGLILIIFFALVAILITFNTVRLAIYSAREEISVMRLVGASSMFIRMPFVVVGLMYGLVSGLITVLLFYPISYWLGPTTYSLGTGLNLFTYYLSNFGQFFVIIVGTGLVLGAISSFLAVKKYLKF